MTDTYHRAAIELRRARSVVVCAHVRPDGDAIGSVLGLTLALRDLGLTVIPTIADGQPAPSTYSFLPGFGLFTPVGELEVPDVFVALDTPNIARLGQAGDLATKARMTISIDHHPDNALFGDVNLADHTSAATAQMVWRLLEVLETRATPDVALCLYVALMTDTGRFQYDNTSAEALRVAAEMVDAGAQPAEASRYVYQERTGASMALEARALSRLTVVNDGRVAYTWIATDDFTETGATPAETETLPDAIRGLGGVDVALLLRVDGSEIRGNLRAKTGFDVGAIARDLGGGGHHAAAGFTFDGTLQELLSIVLPQLPGHPAGAATTAEER